MSWLESRLLSVHAQLSVLFPLKPLLSLVVSQLSAVLVASPSVVAGEVLPRAYLEIISDVVGLLEEWASWFSLSIAVYNFTQPGMAILLGSLVSLLNKTGVSHRLLCVNLYHKAKVVLPLLGGC